MGFAAREIEYVLVKAPDGDITLEAKTGESPEYKLKTGSIESSADGMTNTGSMIFKHMSERTFIQGVFAINDILLDKLQATIDAAKTTDTPEIPVHAIMTDGAIYSNSGLFVGPVVADGPGTATLRFESALDFVTS